jgi:hypothetical protein
MRGIPALGVALALIAAGTCANAASVYRCTAVDGAVGFQDQPCSRDQTQRVVELPDDPPPPATAPTAPLVADTPAMTVDAAPIAPAASSPPPPAFFLCTRYDGSRYLSEDGVGSRSAVPFGMLAGSGQSLSDAYGGRDGIGVSAPGLRQAPSIPSAQMPLAGAYVWIDDECHHAGPAEACAWLRSRFDEVGYKLKRAFSDTAPQLKQEQAALRERMRGC